MNEGLECDYCHKPIEKGQDSVGEITEPNGPAKVYHAENCFFLSRLKKKEATPEEATMIRRRTKIITFERQLWPQPPWNSSPYWWGWGRLTFYDRSHNEVWEQVIPEARELHNAAPEKKHVVCMSVKRMARWGWILTFQFTHDEAENAWPVKLEKEEA